MSDIPKTPCGDISGLPYIFKHTEQVGTHLYMSPEQLQGRQYNYKVDIYSLGLIFFELLVVFGTEMERIETLKLLRMSVFPESFSLSFINEVRHIFARVNWFKPLILFITMNLNKIFLDI